MSETAHLHMTRDAEAAHLLRWEEAGSDFGHHWKRMVRRQQRPDDTARSMHDVTIARDSWAHIKGVTTVFRGSVHVQIRIFASRRSMAVTRYW